MGAAWSSPRRFRLDGSEGMNLSGIFFILYGMIAVGVVGLVVLAIVWKRHGS